MNPREALDLFKKLGDKGVQTGGIFSSLEEVVAVVNAYNSLDGLIISSLTPKEAIPERVLDGENK